MNQKLIILCGLPYSGKTTLRNKLITKFNFSYISVDELIDEKKFHPSIMTQEEWDEVYFLAFENMKQLLKNGKTVIVDIGNLKKQNRDNSKAMADSLNIKHILIYINTPLNEIQKRRKLNEKTKTRGHLDDNLMNQAINMFSNPDNSEKPIIYNENTNFEEFSKKYILL